MRSRTLAALYPMDRWFAALAEWPECLPEIEARMKQEIPNTTHRAAAVEKARAKERAVRENRNGAD